MLDPENQRRSLMGMYCTHENSHVSGSKMVKTTLKEKGMDNHARKASYT